MTDKTGGRIGRIIMDEAHFPGAPQSFYGRAMRRLQAGQPVLLGWDIDSGWPTPRAVQVPPMVRSVPLTPAPEPESASVIMLRSLLADRRTLKARHEGAQKSRIAQADRDEQEAAARVADLRARAADDAETVKQADEEIAAILADIKALGGADEPTE